MKFSKVPIGAYFTMNKGLLWRKVSDTEAVDVWSGRIVKIIAEVLCNVLSKELKEG